jgi:fructose transport system ATP-binding protein
VQGDTSDSLIAVKGIVKRYGGVVALNGIDLELWPGEVVALMGDNGAGKSTLIKLLSGSVPFDSGEMRMQGQPVSLNSPAAARAAGIETVWQDLALAMDMGIAENLYLGRELTWGRVPRLISPLKKKEMEREALRRLADLGIDVSGLNGRSIDGLSGGQVQAIAIARGAAWAAKCLLLDEPTAALGHRQTQIVLELCKRLASKGLCVVIVTHSIQSIIGVADRFVVMRRGEKVADLAGPDVAVDQIVAHIVGAIPPEVKQ